MKVRILWRRLAAAVAAVCLAAVLLWGHSMWQAWCRSPQPRIYARGEAVQLLVDNVWAGDETWGYYETRFTCPPRDGTRAVYSRLGQVFRRETPWESNYELQARVEAQCKALCMRELRPDAHRELIRLIRAGAQVRWTLDGLPAATKYLDRRSGHRYEAGFKLGEVDAETGHVRLNNHVMMVVRYRIPDDGGYVIVGFEAYPRSVADLTCPGGTPEGGYEHFWLNPDVQAMIMVPFTYSVYWREEPRVKWDERWRQYRSLQQVAGTDLLDSLALRRGLLGALLGAVLLGMVVVRLNRRCPASERTLVALLHEDMACSEFHHALVSAGIQTAFIAVAYALVECEHDKAHGVAPLTVFAAAGLCLLGAYLAAFYGVLMKLTGRHLVVNRYPKSCVIYGSLIPLLLFAAAVIVHAIVMLSDRTRGIPFATELAILALYIPASILLSLFGGFTAFSIQRVREDRTSLLGSKGKWVPAPSEQNGHAEKTKRRRLLSHIAAIAYPLLAGVPPFLLARSLVDATYRAVAVATSALELDIFILSALALQGVVVVEVCIGTLLGHIFWGQISHSNGSAYTRNREGILHSWRWKLLGVGGAAAWYLEAHAIQSILRLYAHLGSPNIILAIFYATVLNIAYWLVFGAFGYLVCRALMRSILVRVDTYRQR
ncbi:AaceriAGL295Cp [[Ashbya] aceris (nom. inval.)]|nr:AaceriAGL295Cp [[Ashbya] aceris (nom. inval.)]